MCQVLYAARLAKSAGIPMDILKLTTEIIFKEDKMPVKKMNCPKCKHKYNLPAREAQYGFKRCPKCGHRTKDSKNQQLKNFKSTELVREHIAKAI